MDWDNMMYQTHVGSWAFLLVLFVLAYFFKSKIIHMILRVFFVFMIVSGGYMLFVTGGYPTAFYVKAVVAVTMVGLMEMIISGRHKKGKSNKQLLPFWLGIIVLLAVLLLIAFDVIVF